MRFGVIGPMALNSAMSVRGPAVTLSSSDRGQMSKDVDDFG
jgi:hypothetical protein